MCDGDRITTRGWNRNWSVLTDVNSAGSEIARFISDTAVRHPMQSVFLIFHQSELLLTSDNLNQIPHPGLLVVPYFSFHSNWEKETVETIYSAGGFIDCRIAMTMICKSVSSSCCILNCKPDPAWSYVSFHPWPRLLKNCSVTKNIQSEASCTLKSWT